MEGWLEDEGITLLFQPQVDVKTCPRCGQELFSDMQVCYGCLYDFRAGEEALATEGFDEPAEDGKPDVSQHPSHSLRISSSLLDATVALPREGLVVGRSAECDVVIHQRAVSRKHVRIEPERDGAQVFDLSARNPALLQGEAVGEGAHMEVGDELSICGTKFTLV